MAGSEYMLSHQDVVRAVIIHQNIREGFWTLNINFNVAATHGANVPDPCLAVTIKAIGIMRASPDDPLAIDAAAFNPPVPARIESTPQKVAVSSTPSNGTQFCRDVYRNIAVQSPTRPPAKNI